MQLLPSRSLFRSPVASVLLLVMTGCGGGNTAFLGTADGGLLADGGAADGGGATTDAAPPGPLRVFVTSQGFTGNFAVLAGVDNGLAGADVLCSRAASAAALRGRFVAYLGGRDAARTGVVRAEDRIRGEGPWVAVGSGEVVFKNRAALVADKLPAFRELRTEHGAGVTGVAYDPISPKVWTGTNRSGNPTGDDCADRTIATTVAGGLAQGSCGCVGPDCKETDWLGHGYGTFPGYCFCENPTPYRDDHARLYCFEQGDE